MFSKSAIARIAKEREEQEKFFSGYSDVDRENYLELQKDLIEVNKEINEMALNFRSAGINRITWARIYVLDSAVPFIFGVIANLQIWISLTF